MLLLIISLPPMTFYMSSSHDIAGLLWLYYLLISNIILDPIPQFRKINVLCTSQGYCWIFGSFFIWVFFDFRIVLITDIRIHERKYWLAFLELQLTNDNERFSSNALLLSLASTYSTRPDKLSNILHTTLSQTYQWSIQHILTVNWDQDWHPLRQLVLY